MLQSLTLYNSLTKTKETFEPLDPKHVRMYVCGPTVYDFAHIGNARPVVIFDVLYRVLKLLHPHVTYVRNITDVDDKIMVAAKENNETIESVTTRTTKHFHDDMAALGALPPDIEPRATQHIPQMIQMIEALIKKGHAYESEGHVLFSTPSMKDYGALSGRNRDEQIAGARIDVAPYKKDPADFVLWKPSAPEQLGWESPWGRGRPGWHIECSAMAATHLGEVFDIHGGGIDLIFPHHENEIAQSRCAHGTPVMANVWMHNGFLTVNGEKMSKSLGNFFTVHDLLKEWHGEVIRYALLSAHYRQPLDFTPELLKQAKQSLDRLYGVLRGHSLEELEVDGIEMDAKLVNGSLFDDLNTPTALGFLHFNAWQVGKSDVDTLLNNKKSLRKFGEVMGLLQLDPEDWFRWKPSNDQSGLSDQDIEQFIEMRNNARSNKNFAESDRIRDLLANENVVLEDGAIGTTWRRK